MGGNTGEARGLFDSEAQLVCEEELLVSRGDFTLVVADARFFVADFTEVCATISPSSLAGHSCVCWLLAGRLWTSLGCLGLLGLMFHVLPSQEWPKEKLGRPVGGQSPVPRLILERVCGDINGRMSWGRNRWHARCVLLLKGFGRGC